MPFAKVGAMPQTSSNKKRNGQRINTGGGSSRQKGITMEDLKRQTALRLAQEQQQSQQAASSMDGTREHAFRSLTGQQVSSYRYPSYSPTNTHAEAYTNHGHQGQPTAHVSIQTPHYNADLIPPTGSHQSHMRNEYDMFAPPGSQGFEQGQGHALNSQYTVFSRNDDLMPGHRFVSPDTSPSAMYDPAGMDRSSQSVQRIANTSKQKLPHGLTVYELKEMTKARLQAEAAEKYEAGLASEASAESRRMSPSEFDSVPEIRESTMARDTGRQGSSGLLGSESMNSIPSLVQVNSQSKDAAAMRQPQVSPVPPGFQGLGQTNLGGGHYGSSRGDTMESASVASHGSIALSENMGSESAYSAGLGATFFAPGDADGIPNRSRSFSAHQARGFDDSLFQNNSNISPGHGSSFFEASMGVGNRRRAVTLSPRSVPIHEERPGFHQESLAMPSFSAAKTGTLTSRPTRNSYSPVLDLAFDNSVFSQGSGLMAASSADQNRSRTSSTTSLPPSRDFNDFNRNRANTFNGFSATGGLSSTLTDSFLSGGHGSSFSSPGAHGDGKSLVAPPGFASSTRPGMNATSGTDGRSPWDDRKSGSSTAGTSLFGTNDIDDMATSMGSILKLSGVGTDRPDRERFNTYPSSPYHE